MTGETVQQLIDVTEFPIAFLDKGRAEPHKGIRLKRKNGIAFGLMAMFAATAESYFSGNTSLFQWLAATPLKGPINASHAEAKIPIERPPRFRPTRVLAILSRRENS